MASGGGFQLPRLGLARAARGCGLELPALLDLPEVPDAQGDRPGDDEEPDDHESGTIQVEALDRGPERAGLAGLLGHEAEDLDGPDEHRDEDGQPGDREVVIDL